jgi:hypothetical protein
MKIFLSYRGPVGGVSRKILGEYNLPLDVGFTFALINAKVCAPLFKKYHLAPGALFDFADNGLCRSSPAVAALSRPGGSASPELMELPNASRLQQVFDGRFSRIERAIFGKIPLTSRFFEPERFAVRPERALLLGGSALFSSAEGFAGLNETRPVEYINEVVVQGLKARKPEKTGGGPIRGLLLSVHPECLASHNESLDAWHDVAAARHLETQLENLVCKSLESHTGFSVSPEFVLYPDVEKINDTRKWQTWLHTFLQCVGYGLFTKGIKHSSLSSGEATSGHSPARGIWNIGSLKNSPAVRLFRRGDGSPPIPSRGLIKRIDELLQAEKKRCGGAIPHYVPLKGGMLSFYKDLASTAKSASSIISLPHTNGACGDCG